jgi:NADH-quinone oxidoreductase subunit F
MLPVVDRGVTYQAIEVGLSEDMALHESAHCLRCDICAGCGLCELACADIRIDAIRMERVAGRLVFHDFDRPAERCIGCGACAQVCPEGAIRMQDEKGVRSIHITGTRVSENRLLTCRLCGEPFATEAFVRHLRGVMPPLSISQGELDNMQCPDCARRTRAGLGVLSRP